MRNVLAHRVSVPAFGRALRILFVRMAVLVQNRPPHQLLHVGFGDDGGGARRDDHPVHRARTTNAVNYVIADPADVFVVIVGTYVRHMTDTVTTLEDVIEATVIVDICGVQGEPAARVSGHAFEEARPHRIVDIAHACSNPVTPFEQSPHDPSADEAGSSRDRDRATLRNWRHFSDSSYVWRSGEHRRCLPNSAGRGETPRSGNADHLGARPHDTPELPVDWSAMTTKGPILLGYLEPLPR